MKKVVRELGLGGKILVVGTAEGSIGRTVLEHLQGRGFFVEKFNSLDVRQESDFEAIFAESDYKAMVYCAGIYLGGRVSEMSLGDWNKVIEVNLTGAFLACKHFLRQKGRKRTIILIGANAAHVPGAGSAAYCVSKAGMSMLTQVIAQETDGQGVNIVQLDPGIVRDTGMFHSTPTPLEERLENVPAKRAMTKQEVAEWVEFLLTKGTYANGVNIKVDGGKTAATRRK